MIEHDLFAVLWLVIFAAVISALNKYSTKANKSKVSTPGSDSPTATRKERKKANTSLYVAIVDCLKPC